MNDRTSGVRGLLSSAASGRNDQGYSYYLNGDLCQMSAQERFLSRHGMVLGRRDVYPALKTEEDFKKALTLLWEHKVAGWWHYKKKMVEYGICTEDEYETALGVAFAKPRSR